MLIKLLLPIWKRRWFNIFMIIEVYIISGTGALGRMLSLLQKWLDISDKGPQILFHFVQNHILRIKEKLFVSCCYHCNFQPLQTMWAQYRCTDQIQIWLNKCKSGFECISGCIYKWFGHCAFFDFSFQFAKTWENMLHGRIFVAFQFLGQEIDSWKKFSDCFNCIKISVNKNT